MHSLIVHYVADVKETLMMLDKLQYVVQLRLSLILPH
jgi:hypothetical protein